MSLSVFQQQPFRLQYRRRWADPWLWDFGTAGIGPWEIAGGNRVGSAVFTSITASAAAREEGAAVCPLRQGWFVRICSRARQSDGTLPQKVYWTGYLGEPETSHLGGNPATKSARESIITTSTWPGIGLAGLLAAIDLHRVWRGCGAASSSIRHLEGIVRFCHQRRPDDDIRGGKRLLYAKRGAGTHTLHNILAAILDWHLYDLDGSGAKVARFPHWPAFTLTGLTDALEWQLSDVDLGGSLLEAIAGILNPRRGLFFSAKPPGISEVQTGPVQLVVQTFARSPIVVSLPDGGTQTIPAASSTTSLVADVPHRQLTWAPAPAPRRLTIHGHRDVRIVSLRWKRSGGTETGALARRWDSADDAQAGSTKIEHQHVYRTWGIRQEWDGTCEGTTADLLPTNPTTYGSTGAGDALHGAGGRTGELTTSGHLPFPEFGIEFLDHIPMPSQATNASNQIIALKEWINGTGAVTLDELAAPLRPMAFTVKGTTWTRLNVAISFPDARTVQLGSGPKDAIAIKAALPDETYSLVITCAIVMPEALCVSYIPDVAADADTLIGADRCRHLPWAERIVLHKGTVCGLNPGAAPTAPATDRTVRDDTGALRSTLALCRLSGERSAGGIYVDAAELDTSLEPGQLVKQATMPGAAGTYMDIGYLITSVAYDPSPGAAFKTRATLDTAIIDMDPIA